MSGSDATPDPRWVADALSLASVLSDAADYRPPPSTWARLPELVHGILRDPPRQGVVRPALADHDWRAWRERLAHSTGHVQEGLIAAYYHAERVKHFEDAVLAMCDLHRDAFMRFRGTTGFRSRPLAYEYQAFLFAERRTLEYVAVAAARFFTGRECHRIKGLKAAIADAEPREPRERLEARLETELPQFRLSAAGYRDARDRLAHWEAVDAGAFNIVSHGERLLVTFGRPGAAPGDLLAGTDFEGLSAELSAVAARLERFVFGVYADLGIVDPTAAE